MHLMGAYLICVTHMRVSKCTHRHIYIYIYIYMIQGPFGIISLAFVEAIASRLEIIALKLEAIATRVENTT